MFLSFVLVWKVLVSFLGTEFTWMECSSVFVPDKSFLALLSL